MAGGWTVISFELTAPGFGADARVTRFDIDEALSELYELTLEVVCTDGDIDLGSLVGEEASLALQYAAGTRHIHGIVRRARVHQVGYAVFRYDLVIVPRMWLLTQRRDCRIFQGRSTVKIIEEVLEGVSIQGAALDVALSSAYEDRDYCVQYQESDYDFLHRLMAEEGIHFHFEHTADRHVLVLGDDLLSHAPIPHDDAVVFQPPGTSSSGDDVVSDVSSSREIRPGQVVMKDYAFKTPSDDLTTSASAERDVDLEHYEYPGDYVELSLGQKLAEVRMEALQVGRLTLQGKGNVRRMCAGFTARLTGHPRTELNQELLLTRVVHRGRQSAPYPGFSDIEAGYANHFEAIPSSVQFRPTTSVKRPIIQGLQTARVTGPAGEEIHVDEFGRVKVKFHWDRLGPDDEGSSCWVRVSQGWAGQGFGHVFLPRIGQEVIVQFINGDIDRPLVTGRVYNGEQEHPYPLPDKKTVSTMKSRSSPSSRGYNEFRFEDKAGSEQIYLHAQRAFDEEVLGNHTRTVGADETVQVDGTRTKTIEGRETNHLNAGQDTLITSGQRTEITGGQQYSVEGGQHVLVKGGQTLDVVGDQHVTIKDLQDVTVTGTHKEVITGASSTEVGKARSLKVGGAYEVVAALGVDMTTPQSMAFTAGATWDVKATTSAAITAPKIDMNASFWNDVTPTANSITLFSHSTGGIDIGIKGIVIGHTSLKMEHTACEIGGISVEVKNTPMQIGSHTLNVKQSAFFLFA